MGPEVAPTSSARPSARFDMSTEANQRELDLVEQLARLLEHAGLGVTDVAMHLRQ